MPNYIFPFTSSSDFSVSNSQYFQYLMYRPLYWFGNGASPTLNATLSLAHPPVYSGNNVTINLKGWKWSNGETVTADNVLFWIHMLQAVGSSDWGAFVPGGFPTNVTNVKATNATTITMTMDKAYNPTWFTSNELSQITPMPEAWDRTASGPSHCTTTVSDCAAVYSYLDSQSKNLSGWVSSPLWSIVDGPWKLTAFNSDGNATFVPNASYGGTPKPTAGRVPGGAVHHRIGRVQRAPGQLARGRQQPDDRRGLPADHRRADQAGQRDHRLEPGQQLLPCPAVLVGDQLLPAQLPVHHRQRPGSSSSCTSARRCST